MTWAQAPQGRGCASLDRCAHHDVGYGCDPQNVPPHPANEPDGMPEAQGVCSGGPVGGGSEPMLVKMQSPL
jgi:hypothetical protein